VALYQLSYTPKATGQPAFVGQQHALVAQDSKTIAERPRPQDQASERTADSPRVLTARGSTTLITKVTM
jgi:hypothetical protein